MIFKLKNLRNPSFKNIDCTWKKFIGQADKCTWYKFIGQAFLFKKAFQIYRGSWNMSQFLKNWSKTVLCLLIPLRVNSPWLLELLLLRESVHTLIFWWITFFCYYDRRLFNGASGPRCDHLSHFQILFAFSVTSKKLKNLDD